MRREGTLVSGDMNMEEVLCVFAMKYLMKFVSYDSVVQIKEGCFFLL